MFVVACVVHDDATTVAAVFFLVVSVLIVFVFYFISIFYFTLLCSASWTYTDKQRDTFALADILKTHVHVESLGELAGRCYNQVGAAIGVASYHFNSLADCYISYTKAPATWKLSNGEDPPAKKMFEFVSFDSQTRTFRGVIDWSPLNFYGETMWNYTMVFAKDLSTIESGTLVVTPSGRIQRFGVDLNYTACGEYTGPATPLPSTHTRPPPPLFLTPSRSRTHAH